MFEDSIARIFFSKKALYGLKQALKIWYQTFLDFFRKLDFHKTETNHSFFVSANKTMFIVICINKLLLFSTHIDPQIDNIMQNLQNKFWVTYHPNISHYLDMKAIC